MFRNVVKIVNSTDNLHVSNWIKWGKYQNAYNFVVFKFMKILEPILPTFVKEQTCALYDKQEQH